MKNLLKLSASAIVMVLLINFNLSAQIFNNNKINLTGHVYAGWNNATAIKPLAGATVSLFNFTMHGDTVKYADTTNANGRFEIDSLTPGVYLLTCSAKGYTTLTIKQFMVSKDKDSINLFLHDTSQVKNGVINGIVTYQGTGKPVYNAKLEFRSLTGFEDHDGNNEYSTTTDSMGFYSDSLPAGSYLVICKGPDSMGTLHAWDEGFHNNLISKMVKVMTGDTVSADFQLPLILNGTHTVTFTGMVQSSANTPIANATVKIWTAAKSEYESDDEEGRGFVESAKTDSNGNYSITLDSIPQRLSTFAVAAFKEGYRMQFYNNQNAFYTANLLVSVNDTTFSNIDFNLTQFEKVQKYSISGTVTDSAGMGIKNAFIMAKDSSTGHVHFGISDTSGNYTIKGLTSGSYYVMFSAHGYIPQFYQNADTWEKATLVMVDTDVVNINAALIKSDTVFGSGKIIGSVQTSGGIALPGVLITAKNSIGMTIGWAITNGNGSYTINGISDGGLTITASTPQYTSKQQSTTYNSSSNSGTSVENFTMNKTITSVQTKNSESAVPSRYVLENNYPNPFNPSTIIQFELPASSQVKLDIYNILGQRVAELVNQKLTAGHYSYKFDASNLASGVYLYRLEAGKFVSTKKMILSK